MGNVFWALVEGDVDEVVRPLEVGRTYTARELYRRYVEVTERAGRGPTTPARFGRGLRAAGLHRDLRRIEGAPLRSWVKAPNWTDRSPDQPNGQPAPDAP